MFRAYVVMLKDMPTGTCSPSMKKNWPDLILKGEFLPAKDEQQWVLSDLKKQNNVCHVVSIKAKKIKYFPIRG